MRLLFATFLSLAVGVSVEATDKWFHARTGNFTIVSNGGEGRARSVLEDLEQLKRLISEIFPAQRTDSARPAIFYLFKNEKSMRPFQPRVDGKPEQWAGMYRPTRLRDVVLILGDSSETARKIAYGEYMHVLAGYNEADYPVWLSNGLSLFYGNTEISDKQASIGKMRDEYRRVLGEFRSVPLRELFAVDRQSEFYRDVSKRSLFDAQSWALVHYLLIGQLEANGPQRLGQYLRMLDEGREPLLAFQEAMGKTLDSIDEEVAFYIRKKISYHLKVKLPSLDTEAEVRITRLDAAASAAHTGLLYMAARHEQEAETSLTSSIEIDPDQVFAFEAMGSLRDRQRKTGEALAFLERAIRNGSTNALAHFRYAELFVGAGDGEAMSALPAEAKAPVFESLRLVIRDSPELVDAARMFAYLALFDADRRPEARQLVETALESDPGNASLVFALGQLYSGDGSFAAARVIFKKLLDRELEPAFVASVRRQYDFADAQVRIQAERAAAVTAAANTAAGSERAPASVPAVEPAGVLPLPEMSRAAPGEEEVRGRLVRFDCAGGHRFIVASNGREYVLDIDDLAEVILIENGGQAVTREFSCGPLDEPVTARYIPAESGDGASERRGRLVFIDFVGR